MKILILSQALANYKELTDITWTNQRAYATRQGYDFFGQMGPYCDLGYDYQRIQLLYDVLFKESLGVRYDAVWWLGTDAMVMNHTKRIEEYMTVTDKSLYVHLDVNGLNNDSFVLRNTEWSRRWLQMTLDKEQEYRSHCWESQKCWQEHLTRNESNGTPWRNEIEILNHPSINSYLYRFYNWPESTPGNFSKGDFVLHLPGMNLDQRLAIFRSGEIKSYLIT